MARIVWLRRFADPLVDAETFRINDSGQLLEIGAKTTRIEEITGPYIGLLKFTPPAWRVVEELLGSLDGAIRDLQVQLGRELFGKCLEFAEKRIATLTAIETTYVTRGWAASTRLDTTVIRFAATVFSMIG